MPFKRYVVHLRARGLNISSLRRRRALKMEIPADAKMFMLRHHNN
jgi:hypothetical protein